MDRTGANFYNVYEQVRDRLLSNAVPVQIPIGAEAGFQGVVDLITMRAFIHKDDIGKDIEEVDIPADLAERAAEFRLKLVEAAAETTDELMEKYLDGGDLSQEEIKLALRKGTVTGAIVPMFCGSAFKNKGVQQLLDGVIDYLPAPTEVPPIKGIIPNSAEGEGEVERHADDNEPFAALAFKIMSDKFGRLTFIRVYSGVLKTGTYVLNAAKGKRERVSRLIILKADDRQEVDELRAGDLGAVLGLKDTFTGDTLCDEDNPVILESLFIPEPRYGEAVQSPPVSFGRRSHLPGSHRPRNQPDCDRRNGRAALGNLG
jgi:elongation factor G